MGCVSGVGGGVGGVTMSLSLRLGFIDFGFIKRFCKLVWLYIFFLSTIKSDRSKNEKGWSGSWSLKGAKSVRKNIDLNFKRSTKVLGDQKSVRSQSQYLKSTPLRLKSSDLWKIGLILKNHYFNLKKCHSDLEELELDQKTHTDI